jgi:cytochrome bd-type quinol oxidase subunit 2
MDIINALGLILGGILALSGVIVIRRPDLKPQLDKLVPFQALIGVGLIIAAIVNTLRWLSWLTDVFHQNQVYACAVWCMLIASVLLGALFGWPLIASWIPDQSPAKPKVQQITQNLAPFQVLIGAGGILTSVVYLLFRFHVLSIQGITN